MTGDRTNAASAADKHADKGEAASPESIIVDLGKGKRKDVRKLRKGKSGKLTRKVEKAVAHLHESGELAAGAQVVVVVVRQRRRRRKPGMLGLR